MDGYCPWKYYRNKGKRTTTVKTLFGEVFSSLVPLVETKRKCVLEGRFHLLHYQKVKKETDIIEKNEKVPTIT